MHASTNSFSKRSLLRNDAAKPKRNDAARPNSLDKLKPKHNANKRHARRRHARRRHARRPNASGMRPLLAVPRQQRPKPIGQRLQPQQSLPLSATATWPLTRPNPPLHPPLRLRRMPTARSAPHSQLTVADFPCLSQEDIASRVTMEHTTSQDSMGYNSIVKASTSRDL